MNTEPVHLYAAILDVLAYRCYLDQDRKSGTLAFQEKLSSALAVFASFNDAIYSVRAISDTLIVTCPDHAHFPEFLGILRDVFVGFLGQGLFVRGGVAFSQHFQSGNLTYSHAIARAYDLESKTAVYPRIVIDANILAMYEAGRSLPQIRDRGLLCKENGIFFLNVLTADNWEKVYDYARSIYKECADAIQEDEAALGKHLRFQRYLLNSPYTTPNATDYVGGVDFV